MKLEQGDLILEILKKTQSHVTEIKRDAASLSVRLSSLDDYCRGSLKRLGLRDTEH